MQFNVILGNPPYGDKHNYLYCDFINQTISDNGMQPDYFTMINPSRYMTAADRQFRQIRQYFYSGCIDKIVDFPDSKDIFENVQIAGGVSYYVYNKKRETDNDTVVDTIKNIGGKLETIDSGEYDLSEFASLDMIPRSYTSRNILHKVKTIAGIEFTGETSKVAEGLRNSLSSSVKMNAYGLLRSFDGDILDKTGHQIKIYKAGKDVFGTDDINCVYVDKDEIDLYRNNGFNEQALTKYKVHVPYDGDYRDRYKKNLVAGPGELTTLQFTLVRMFDTMSEAENLMKYLQTDLIIYLISSLQASFNITASNFRLVPDQDFTNNSDIDWSKGLDDLNKQLYKKYNISDNEIKYIKESLTGNERRS